MTYDPFRDARMQIDDGLGLRRYAPQTAPSPLSQLGARYAPQSFHMGGLSTSLPGAFETHQSDMDFIRDRDAQMHAVAGEFHMAQGGGVWTRKAGQNPEGGLNAAGRASLRAQGHDIKPPVSAKQAKKSPKAAARRKSFCARSAGQAKMYPEAARDPSSRLSKARRKWDC